MIYYVYVVYIPYMYTVYTKYMLPKICFDQSQPWSTVTLNRILQTCLVSDRKGNNIDNFQTVEFD